MSHFTPFAGLTAPDPDDDISVNGASFIYANPDKTDRVLKIGALTHRHDAHPAQANPLGGCSASVSPAGGTIPARVTIYVGYTLTDNQGGETTLSRVVSVTTQDPLPNLSPGPTASADYTSGSLVTGDYQYGLTYVDGGGGETPISTPTFVSRDPGYPNGQMFLSGLAEGLGSGAVSWRLWRAIQGSQWALIATGNTDAFTDTGLICTDFSQQPPTTNRTNSTNSLSVTYPSLAEDPSIAGATSIRLYLSTDGTFAEPCFYGSAASGAAGTTVVIPALTLSQGAPPNVSTCIPGANLINPDTDLLDWHWKRPVLDHANLPAGSAGDVRLVTDTGELFAVLGASAAGSSDWTLIGGGAGGAGTVVTASGQSFPAFDFEAGDGIVMTVTPTGGGSATVTFSAPGGVGGSGSVGPAGASGAPGPQGPAGASGAPGASGGPGPQGPAGASGAPGASGGPGPQGPPGASGAPGPQGIQGGGSASTPTVAGSGGVTPVSGYYTEYAGSGGTGVAVINLGGGSARVLIGAASGGVGPAGASGAPGPQGASGAPGAQGASGAPGPAGASGAPGPAGASGATGPQGASGAPGQIGPQGPAGSGAGLTSFPASGGVGSALVGSAGMEFVGSGGATVNVTSVGGSAVVTITTQPAGIGPAGASGASGGAGLGITWKGSWAPSAYASQDAVSASGQSYIAASANVNVNPITPRGSVRTIDPFTTNDVATNWLNVTSTGNTMGGGSFAQTGGRAEMYYKPVSFGAGSVTVGASVVGGGGYGAAITPNNGVNWITALFSGGTLYLYHNFTLLTSVAYSGTATWSRITRNGNVVTGACYAGDPDTTAPLGTVTYTLTGADIATFAGNVLGGFYDNTGGSTFTTFRVDYTGAVPNPWNLIAASGASGAVGASGTAGASGAPGPAGASGAPVTPPTIAASAGASAVTPDYYTEYAGSGGVGVAVQNMGGGSARVLVGLAPTQFYPNQIAPPIPVGGGVVYVSAGALHFLGSSGTDTVIAPA